MATTFPATPAQLDFLISLGKQARERVNALPEGDDRRTGYTILLDELGKQVRDGISKADASLAIDALKQVKEDCPPARTGGGSDRPEPEAGMYQTPNGQIYRVYLGQKSGRMLVKELTGDPASGFSYDYVGAAAYKLPGDARPLPLEEAKQFGKMTGHCCVCARRLDNPESVDAGIGPVCAGRMEEGFTR